MICVAIQEKRQAVNLYLNGNIQRTQTESVLSEIKCAKKPIARNHKDYRTSVP